MNTASNIFNDYLLPTLDENAEIAMREFTMTNIERTFIDDNKYFWLNIAIQFEARTRRLSKISNNYLCFSNERSLLVFERARKVAMARSKCGFGLHQLKNQTMQPVKRFYQSLLILSENVADNKAKMNIINSCLGILCKMVYPHLDANHVEAHSLIKNAIADINCSDKMSHEEKQNWLICTQRLNKKLEKASGSVLNPPSLRLV